MQTFINNRYRVIEQLGRGGMGAVYLVEDVLHENSLLALKTIRADLLAERNLTQFKYEFTALGQLHHPNLIEVYDFGVIANPNRYSGNSDYFFTMEYVPGEDLLKIAKKYEGDDYTWLYEATVQICRALQYIHSRGFIHYDVKPHNIRLTQTGQIKLMDFGLVGEVRGQGQLKVRGTPEYIAPEMIRGDSVDHRADLYSLGISLYEMVIGHTPFTGESSISIFKQHVDAHPEFPRHFVHYLPEDIQSLILKLMAKEPVNRYPTANAVIQAINDLTGLNFPVETKETKQSYIQSGRFVGRTFELARLQGLLVRTMQGQGRLVLINGPAGVGKSRLLRELRLRAQMQRMLVCEGVCREQGRSPYHAWLPILGQLISYQQTAQSEALKLYGAKLVRLMPELAELLDDVLEEQPETDPEQVHKELLMANVINFLTACDRPLMLVVEDLHFADTETIELLDYLGQHTNPTRLEGGRWLICGTYRDGEINEHHPLNGLIYRARHINQENSGSEAHPSQDLPYDLLYLNSFDEDNATNLVKSMLGVTELPSALMPRLMAETGGNALFIESLMQSLLEEDLLQYDGEQWQIDVSNLSQIPASIQEAARRRMAYLDRDSLELLQWAAIMGQWLELDILAEISGFNTDQVFRLVAAATQLHVLSTINQRVGASRIGEMTHRFSTDQMREVIYNTLPQVALAQRHRRVGRALQKRYDESEISERLAWHFERSEDWGLALRYAKMSGEKARQRHANESAVQYYTQALTLLRLHEEIYDHQLEYDLLAYREDCYRLLGNQEAQETDLAQMMDVARTMSSVPRQIMTYTRQVSLANRQGNFAQAKRAASAAMALTWQIGDQKLEAETLTSLGTACLRLGELERAHASHEHALSIYEELDDTLGKARSLFQLGNVAQASEQPKLAQDYFKQSLELYKKTEQQRGEAEVLQALGALATNYATRISYYQEALVITESIDDRMGQVRLRTNLGQIYNILGLYDRAKGYLRQAVKVARGIKADHLKMIALQALGETYMALGHYDVAQQNFERSQRVAEREELVTPQLNCRVLLGELTFHRKQYIHAQEQLEETVEALRQQIDDEDDETLTEQLLIALAYLGIAQTEAGDWHAGHRATSEAIARLDKKVEDEEEPLTMQASPAREVWWWHYQVLKAVYDWSEGEPLSEEAETCLRHAHNAVMAVIATLDDKQLQKSYLEQVQINNDIIAEWTKHTTRTLGQLIESGEYEAATLLKSNLPSTTEDKLKLILEMSVHMGEMQDVDILLDFVIDRVMELTGAQRGFLMLLNKQGQMDFRVTRGVAQEDMEQATKQISYTVIGTVTQSKRPLLLEDALTDPRYSRQTSVLDLNLHSVLCVPLITRSDLIGLIYADSQLASGHFSQSDIDLMTIFANQAAIAIENTRLYQETIRGSQELEAWAKTLEERVESRTAELQQANLALLDRAVQLQISSQVAQQITSILDLDELLHQLVELIASSFGYYFVGVWLLSEKGDYLTLRAGTGEAGSHFKMQGFRMPISTASLITQVCSTGEEGLINNTHKATNYLALEGLSSAAAELALPLYSNQQVMGVLDIQSEDFTAFDTDEKVVLQLLADQTSIAIRNAQLYEAEQNRRQLAEAMEETGRILTSSLNLNEITERILHELASAVPYERGLVLLYDEEESAAENTLHVSAQRGFPKTNTPLKEPQITVLERTVFKRLTREQRPVVLDDVTQELTWQQQSWLPLNRSWLGVPLTVKERIIGMLSLTRQERGAFNKDEISMVQAFATQAAIALENANLYSKIQSLNEQLEEGVRERTEQLNRMNHALEKMNKTKTDFINVAAHELRTPLTAISTCAQILQVHPAIRDNDNLQEAVEGLVSGFENLQNVVNSMLDVAKIDSETLQMHPQETLLGIIIDRACAKFKEDLLTRDLTLLMDDMESFPAVLGDPNLLSKVFMNLISNAIKYTPDGGSISITHQVDRSNGQPMVEVVISDTGIGIDPQNTEAIFEKFFQTGETKLHSSGRTKFKGGGPGLGLAIVKGIVQAHGGQIWAESTSHNEETFPGSHFHVRLPVC